MIVEVVEGKRRQSHHRIRKEGVQARVSSEAIAESSLSRARHPKSAVVLRASFLLLFKVVHKVVPAVERVEADVGPLLELGLEGGGVEGKG